MGYTTRAYLSNHGIERESQLEFYKGFLSHKGTNSSINRIVNNNSNFKDIKHSDIWAVKLSDYGQVSTNLTMTKDITVNDMISDPFLIDYPNITKWLHKMIDEDPKVLEAHKVSRKLAVASRKKAAKL